MNSVKRQKDIRPEDGPLRSVGIQYAIGEEWREIINSYGNNEAAGLKCKQC